MGLRLATSLKSWLEDVGPLMGVLRRVKANQVPDPHKGPAQSRQTGSAGADMAASPPMAIVRAVKHMTQRMQVLQRDYAALTGQALSASTSGVSAAASARDKAEAASERVGRLQEAALWSSTMAQRAFSSVTATLNKHLTVAEASRRLVSAGAVAATPEAGSCAVLPVGFLPPGHTRESWGSLSIVSHPAAAVPPGHTRQSWGAGTALDDIAEQLCRMCLRHRAMMGDGEFRETLQDDVAGVVVRLKQAERQAREAGERDAAPSVRDSAPSVGNFAFGLSPLPSIWAVIAHPAVAGAIAAARSCCPEASQAAADGPCCLVLGSSTGIIPLALAAATGLPCDGVELLPALHRISRAEQRRVAHSCRAASQEARMHVDTHHHLPVTGHHSPARGPSRKDRVSAMEACRLVLGDATDERLRWPLTAEPSTAEPSSAEPSTAEPSSSEAGPCPYRIVWLTALCWDERVRERALRRIVARCGSGTIVVDYSAPPSGLLLGAGGTGRGLRGVARIRLLPGGATWAPAAGGIRQQMWVSRVEDEAE
jgi:hypothetical protein